MDRRCGCRAPTMPASAAGHGTEAPAAGDILLSNLGATVEDDGRRRTPIGFVACNGSSEIVEISLRDWGLVRRIPAGAGVYNLGMTRDGRLVATNRRDQMSPFSTQSPARSSHASGRSERSSTAWPFHPMTATRSSPLKGSRPNQEHSRGPRSQVLDDGGQRRRQATGRRHRGREDGRPVSGLISAWPQSFVLSSVVPGPIGPRTKNRTKDSRDVNSMSALAPHFARSAGSTIFVTQIPV